MSQHNQQSGSRKLFVVIAGAFLLIVGVVALLLISGQSELDARVAALKESGMPMTGSELNDFYVVPADVPNSTLEWRAACGLVRSKSFGESVMPLPILGRGEDIPAPGEPWAQFDECKNALETTASMELAAIRRALSVGGRVRFPVNFEDGIETLLTDTQEMRTHARLLALDANVAAHEGDTQRVIDDIRGMLAVSDALAEEPIIISHLVRMAIFSMAIEQAQKLLPHCKCTDSQLADLQTAVIQADLRTGVRRAYIGERAIGFDYIGQLSMAPFRAGSQHEALDVYEQAIEHHDKTWSETKQWQSETDARLYGLSQGTLSKLRYRGVLMAMPAIVQVTAATVRTEAKQRCFVLGLGAMRQKLRNGRMPTSMPDADLLPENDAVTQDPFADQLMLIKSDEGSITFYSVGENEADDGGQIQTDQGQALDVGFRLP